MEGDPTGGMWIYLIFFIIPLVRILPRLLRKYRHKNVESEPDEQHSQKGFFADKFQNDQNLEKYHPNHQDIEKKNHLNQNLKKKMVG